MLETEDVSDEDFEQALADKKHLELLQAISELISSIKENNEGSELEVLINALDINNTNLKGFLLKLQSTLVPDKTLILSSQLIQAELQDSNRLLAKLVADREKTKEIIFTRNNSGFIESPIIVRNEGEY